MHFKEFGKLNLVLGGDTVAYTDIFPRPIFPDTS